jgi:hypothetical protein
VKLNNETTTNFRKDHQAEASKLPRELGDLLPHGITETRFSGGIMDFTNLLVNTRTQNCPI